MHYCVTVATSGTAGRTSLPEPTHSRSTRLSYRLSQLVQRLTRLGCDADRREFAHAGAASGAWRPTSRGPAPRGSPSWGPLTGLSTAGCQPSAGESNTAVIASPSPEESPVRNTGPFRRASEVIRRSRSRPSLTPWHGAGAGRGSSASRMASRASDAVTGRRRRRYATRTTAYARPIALRLVR